MTSPQIELAVEVVQKWQMIVDLLAEILHVPSARVMKVEPPSIRVLVSSESEGNPYKKDELAALNTGLYCETVMKMRQPLVVPDALADDNWKSNPDIKVGMISYLGFPVMWPDGKIFGTICVLDNKRNDYGGLHRTLLLHCRDVLQADLGSAAELGKELAAQKAQLDQLFEQAPEAIVLLDVEDRVLRINAEFTRIFGYIPHEAVGRPINDLIAPEELQAEAEEYTNRIIHGKTVNAETIRRCKDGSRVPVSLLAIPICSPDGQIAEYAIYRDLTEHRAVEGELTKQRAHLDELFETIPEGIAQLDLRDKIIRVNREFSRIFGYSMKEVVGRSLNELIVPSELQGQAEEFTKQVVVRGETLNVETVRRGKDGSRFPVSLIAVPVSAGQGQIAEYAIYRDITERKRLQDQVKFERDRLRLLLDLNNALVSNLDLRQLFEALSTKLFSAMHCDHAVLLLPDKESGQLRMEMLYRPSGRGVAHEGMLVPINGSVSGKVFRTKKAILVNNFDDLRQDPEVYANPEGLPFYQQVAGEDVKSGCFLPLISRDRILGVLDVCKRPEKAFEAEDAEFLEQVARQVSIAVENALEYRSINDARERLVEQRLYLQEEIRSEQNLGEIIGDSRSLKVALEQVSVVAPTDSSVLILGETGTGKELIARAIHDLSARRDRSFVKLNCAAIPLGLLESELFGHEKGAFTGAIAQKVGRFELANKGTLFLDEVGDIPLELQAKLLRVLQEQEFERLGSNRTNKVDVRIIAATNRDLAKMVEQRAFRDDLYYRLKVFPISVPPLRERTEDIPPLVHHFVSHYARRMNKRIESIPTETMEALLRYQWPGNIRELQNFVERAVILSPKSVLRAPLGELAPSARAPQATPATILPLQTERENILRVLDETNWVIGGPHGAAARLGLKRTSLVYRMQKFKIERPVH